MSRISGILNTSPNSPSLSPEMLISLEDAMLCHMHGVGQWINRHYTNNTCIIGETSVKEPSIERKRGVIAAIDGLFYNKESLPSGSNNADIFIQLYKSLGFEAALNKINGDFSIALFDEQDNSIWLTRDRIGLRPLYYTENIGILAFSSRPLPLTFLPKVGKSLNNAFVGLFAGSHYRTIDNDRHASPYANIRQLPAGHYLRHKNGQTTIHAWWSIENSATPETTEAELAEKYRDLLKDSVARRYKETSQPAFTLSGGMDSSSVLSCAVETSGNKQVAWSSVYTDPTYDETNEIQSMLADKVSQWNRVEIETPNTLNLIREMIGLHDEPVATATWLSHYLLAKEASEKGHDALFGGLGGDELNGGEYEYFFCLFADLKRQNKHEALNTEIREWVRHHDHPIFHKNFDVARAGWEKLADLEHPGKCLPDRQRIEKYASTINTEFYDVRQFNPVMDIIFDSYMSNRTYQDIFRETSPCCIRAEDRQTDPFGMDNILPFFDYRLVEFMFSLGNQHKIQNGITKRLLRTAMKGILPEETRTRIKKTGWNAPAHVWFSGDGLEELRDLVFSTKFRNRGIYNMDKVARLFDEHKEIIQHGKSVENHMMFFWQLSNIALWLEHLDSFPTHRITEI
ncbi:asparagine synthetase B family protein [Thalassospira tepidiphila]|uniref:asparagine synthetase B family protein n=1 Tax=Thalassospira tepidiphila TaxID=393657 RepID=UPI003AA90AA6